MATTMSLLVIFLPVVFMGGRVGQFFSSFGATVAFAIFMSLCVSFTHDAHALLPVPEIEGRPRGQQIGLGLARRSTASTAGSSAWSLRHRWVIVLCCVGCLAVTPFLFSIVGFDFVPRDDQSEFEVAITMPEGYTLERADKLFAEIEGRLGGLRGVEHVFSIIGDTTGRISRGQGDVTAGTIYAPPGRPGKAAAHVVRSRCSGATASAARSRTTTSTYTQFDVQDDARRDHEGLSRPPRRRAGRGDDFRPPASGSR